ncbi:MAG TPA: hypothetical protein VK988_01140, partial [Acidimicrobiales bacterium]|nr:hypothetical protein [Acidimicrobiales bacterium]
MVSRRELEGLRRAANTARPADLPTVEMPDNIVEFATSPEYLGLDLYPMQAMVLKIITLAASLFTDFDHRVLERWAAGFELSADADQARYRGVYGIVPDVLDRIEWCRSQGRPWFREVVLVMGRRGSKNFLASIVLAWRLWHLLALGDPQSHYRIPKSKTLAVHTFGTDQVTLRRNAFGDIVGLLRTAPCFAPFLGAATTTSITLLTPAQLAAGAQ